MDDGNPITGMVIILFMILLSAVISSAKAALVNVNENNVKKKAESVILEKPGRYLNVLELLHSFIHIIIGMTFISYFPPRIETMIVNSGIATNSNMIRPAYYIFFTVMMVLVTALFGSILSKYLTIKHADTMACSDNVTEEEIISMMNEGQEQGVFNAGEVEMISNIIELGEKEAQDIMTHKKKIIAVNVEMTIEEALHFMLSEKYSRYPLYEGNRDNIIGILYMKDVISAYISEVSKHNSLKEITRVPYFVPDTQNINILFHEMQLKNIHMAIVIDEYGQTAGLVAMEDFIEEIVGNIQDEYDIEESMILTTEETCVTVKGSISLEELQEKLDINLYSEDFDTLNGLLISFLNRIPGDGEKATLNFQGYRLDVLETKNKMIQQVRISKMTTEDETSQPDEQ
jgi:putative hemolysin